MTRYARYGFSGSVLVAREGEVVFEGAYGEADAERSRPITTTTRFPLASVTKQFTAAAVLRLAEQGQLSLKDSLPTFFKAVPDDKAAITVDQLLAHTSGLESIGGRFDPKEAWARKKLLRAILNVDLRTEPGARVDYENENYNLLALIIERVSGRSYPRYLRETFFEPLGMDDTSTRSGNFASDSTVALGHVGEGTDVRSVLEPYTVALLGAGGIASTQRDLYRWVRALRSGEVLGATMLDRMFAIQARNGESGLGWGYGWVTDTRRGDDTGWEAAGDLRGLQTQLQIYPQRGITVIVLCNTRVDDYGWRDPVARRLATLADGRPVEIPPEVRAGRGMPSALVADYVLPDGGTFRIQLAGGVPYVEARGPVAARTLLYPGDSMPNLRRLRVLNRRAVSIAKGMLEGDFGPASRYLTSYWLEQATGLWDKLRQTAGFPEGYRLLGNAPNGPDRFTTFVEFHFAAREPLVTRFYWDQSDEQIVGIGTGRPSPVRTRMHPVSSTQWVTFSPAESVKNRFDFRKAGLSSTELVITGRGHLRTARRVRR